MAANAYILINVEPAKTQEVLERLEGVSGGQVREVLGPYDIVTGSRHSGRSDRNPAPPHPPHQRGHQHRNLLVVLRTEPRNAVIASAAWQSRWRPSTGSG